MADREYMTSQTYDATIGGVVYNVTVSLDVIPVWVAANSGIYNVMAYGATGLGVADDITALQAAVDAAEAAGGGAVFVPSGDYLISTHIVMDSPNVTIYGMGASSRIIADDGSGSFVIKTSAAGIKIKDMTFVGGVNTEPVAANECISLLSGSENTEISGCIFTGTDATHGFNCQIRGAAGCNNPRIVNNYFERVVGTNSGNGYGIQIASVHGGVIEGNVSVQSTTQGRHHIYMSVDCTDLSVANNRLYGGVHGMIDVYSVTVAARGITITGNTLNGAGTGGGTGGAIELVQMVEDCVVSGNTIYDMAGHGIKLESSALAVSACLNNSVKNNTISTVGLSGIYNIGALGASIVGNTIVDCGGGTPGPAIVMFNNGLALVDGGTINSNTVVGATHDYSLRYNGDYMVVSGNTWSAGTTGWYTATSVTNSVYVGNTGPASDVGLASGDDTTPTVLGLRLLRIHGNYQATAITQLDDGVAAQVVTLVNTLDEFPSTITDGGNFHLLGGNWGGVQYSAITLYTYDGSTWIELSRS